ncbi:hypothetical protein A9R05_05315 [Burkholderia sp. KK1]|nr:hypothetical protein A9R05_05315 [Burkholderia sp. KK1]
MTENQKRQLFVAARNADSFDWFDAIVDWKAIAAALDKSAVIRDVIDAWDAYVADRSNEQAANLFVLAMNALRDGVPPAECAESGKEEAVGDFQETEGELAYWAQFDKSAPPSKSAESGKEEATSKDLARRFVGDFTREMGFTMSDHAQEVMLNLFLRYAAPTPERANEALELAVALEQQRALHIVQAVRKQGFAKSGNEIPTQAESIFDLACEEIEHRLRTEAWELDGVAAPRPAAQDDVRMTGTAKATQDVFNERQRQMEREGWTPEHDDEYTSQELSLAAVCYADFDHYEYTASSVGKVPCSWPWDDNWWKPTMPRRNLVKAGALIIAEIERLDRAAIAKEKQR